MKNFLSKIVKSLDLTDEGFSFRKILSLIVMGLIIYMHFTYVKESNVLTAILYDFGFICVLLGLLNLDKFIDAKYGAEKAPPTEEVVNEEPPVEDPKV